MAKKHSEGKREGMAGYGTYGRIPVTALEMELLGMVCEYEDWLSRLGDGEMDTVAESDVDMARLNLVRGLVAKVRDFPRRHRGGDGRRRDGGRHGVLHRGDKSSKGKRPGDAEGTRGGIGETNVRGVVEL